MEALNWIGELVQWVGAFIPRLGICRATHGGVKFRRGKHVIRIEPGLYVYWPITTEVVVVPTARQSADLPSQTLVTRDGATVLVSTVLVYEVEDAVKGLGKTWDLDALVMEVGATAAVRAVVSRTFSELRKDLMGAVTSDLTRKCRSLLRPFGVRVREARFSDFAKAQVIRTVGTEATLPVPATGRTDGCREA